MFIPGLANSIKPQNQLQKYNIQHYRIGFVAGPGCGFVEASDVHQVVYVGLGVLRTEFEVAPEHPDGCLRDVVLLKEPNVQGPNSVVLGHWERS